MYSDIIYTIVDIETNGTLEISNETNTYFVANAVSNFERRVIDKIHFSPFIKSKGLNFVCVSFYDLPEYSILFQNCSEFYINNLTTRINTLISIHSKYQIPSENIIR